MKSNLSHLDQYRVSHPTAGDAPPGSTWGMFAIPHLDQWQRSQFQAHYIVLASDGNNHPDGSKGTGWDHISVHCRSIRKNKRTLHTPTWEDMEHIRSLFFDDDETVMQLSVPRADHISIHNHVLHLWRPTECAVPVPPPYLV